MNGTDKVKQSTLLFSNTVHTYQSYLRNLPAKLQSIGTHQHYRNYLNHQHLLSLQSSLQQRLILMKESLLDSPTLSSPNLTLRREVEQLRKLNGEYECIRIKLEEQVGKEREEVQIKRAEAEMRKVREKVRLRKILVDGQHQHRRVIHREKENIEAILEREERKNMLLEIVRDYLQDKGVSVHKLSKEISWKQDSILDLKGSL